MERFKERARELTQRTRGVSLEGMVQELNQYLRGWHGYFGFCQTPSVLEDLDSWLRRRLRCFVWKQWKRGRTRYKELRKRGVNGRLAAQAAGSPHGPWRLSQSPALCLVFPNAFFDGIRLFRLAVGR
jgi:RNA-directed DNA polymerase